MRDVLLKVTKALPAAAANNDTDTLDLGPQGGRHRGATLQLYIDMPATPSLVDTKLITLTIKDSADDSSFAAVDGLSTITIAGVATSQGGAATVKKIKLPDHCRRYIRINQAVETGGGSNIAISGIYSLIYPGNTPAGV